MVKKQIFRAFCGADLTAADNRKQLYPAFSGGRVSFPLKGKNMAIPAAIFA